MNRADYRQAYRSARACYRFFHAVRASFDAAGRLPEFLTDAADACPGYEFTRLHGDLLSFAPYRGTPPHRRMFRLPHLRKRARLPA